VFIIRPIWAPALTCTFGFPRLTWFVTLNTLSGIILKRPAFALIEQEK